jgi:hypothetical protein
MIHLLFVKHFSRGKEAVTSGTLLSRCRTVILAVVAWFSLATAAYAVNPPVITQGTGVYNASQTQATITGDTGATFYYTLDGSTPTTSSTLYATAISISDPAVVKAIAFISPNTSTVTSAYIQSDPNAAPVPRTGLSVWLRSDFGVVTSGSSVNTWVDLSGSGNNGTQGTTAKQPTVVSSAINGRNGIKFNGTTQNLALPTGFASFTGSTIFIVAQPNAVTAGARLIDLGNGATSNNILIQEPTSTGAAFYIYNAASPTSVTSSSALTLKQFHLLEVVDSGTTATIYTDGVLGATSAAMNTINNVSRANNFIGQSSSGTNFYNGQIAELLVYNVTLTADQIADVEAYIAARYQIAAQVPVAPIVSVATSTLTQPTQVALAADPTADIRFTIDGTTPTSTSNLYLGPVNVYYTQTLKAIAIINGISSSVTSTTYTLNSTQFPAPNVSDTTPLQINTVLPNISIP